MYFVGVRLSAIGFLSVYLRLGFALTASYFSFNSKRKVTKRMPSRLDSPSGSLALFFVSFRLVVLIGFG